MYKWSDLPPELAEKSHGHVSVRPDDLLARCGGPAFCETCREELRFFERRPPGSNDDLIRDLRSEIARLRADKDYWVALHKKEMGRSEAHRAECEELATENVRLRADVERKDEALRAVQGSFGRTDYYDGSEKRRVLGLVTAALAQTQGSNDV